MKKIILIITTLMLSVALNAQELSSIKLNTPDLNRGAGIMKAFANRKSVNEYSNKMLSLDDLSDLLWAANGINRPEEGKRTAASALDKQDVMIYTFTTEGVHLYDAKKHELMPIVKGDHRKLFGERGMAPLIVLLVTDIAKFGERGTPDTAKEWGAIDIGLVSQNIALFCSGNDIDTRPRASMDREAIKRLLGLTNSQLPMLNHAVGYAK